MPRARFAMMVAAIALLVACRDAPEERAAPTGATTAAENQPGETPPEASGSAKPPAAPPPPQITSPEELRNAVVAELTEAGWTALVRKDGSDRSKFEPLSLVTFDGRSKLEKVELPFSSAGDLKGSPHLADWNLKARRFLFSEGALPKVKVRVWENGQVGPAVEGSLPSLGSGIIAETQALVIFGKMDRRGFVDRPNGPRAARYRSGAWSLLDLPPPAEKGWHNCFWDAEARPGSDDLVLLQICAAPRREMAYALYRLPGDGDTVTRIPFDNEVFNPVRAARGEFNVEDDGTINLGSQVSGREEGEMTLARLRGGREPWKVVKVRMPSRLMSTVAVYGDRLLFTDGGDDLRGSADGGATFQNLKPLASGPGMFGRCNGWGCPFNVFGNGDGGDRVFLRRWPARADLP